MSEIERRLAVLETVLGVDPEVKCHGAGEPCPDICDPTTCPLQTNNVQGIAQMLSDVLDKYLLIQCWAQELEGATRIPAGSWGRAEMRMRLIRIDERLSRAQEIRTRLGTVGEGSYLEGVNTQIQELQRERADLQASLTIGGTK